MKSRAAWLQHVNGKSESNKPKTAERKFKNVPDFRGDIRFASKAEARRYDELLLLVKAGAVFNLRLQPRYPLVFNNKRLGVYVADFEYRTTDNTLVIEDIKGFRDKRSPAYRLYRLKTAILSAILGTDVTEIN